MHHSRYVASLLKALAVILSFNSLLIQVTSRHLRSEPKFSVNYANEEQDDHEAHATKHIHDRNLAVQSYTQLSHSAIEAQLQTLANDHSDFVTLYTSQEKYGLPSSCGDNEAQHSGCHNSFIIIEDPARYANAARAKQERPDVLISGALHGDERVGPVAALETAKLLALAASCQAGVWDKTACYELESKHTAPIVNWLARLVSTRRIIIIPTTNAKGYSKNIREEPYVSRYGLHLID